MNTPSSLTQYTFYHHGYSTRALPFLITERLIAGCFQPSPPLNMKLTANFLASLQLQDIGFVIIRWSDNGVASFPASLQVQELPAFTKRLIAGCLSTIIHLRFWHKVPSTYSFLAQSSLHPYYPR